MSDAASQFYEQQFGLDDDTLRHFLHPVSTHALGTNPGGLDVHTWRDDPETRSMVGLKLYGQVAQNAEVILPVVKRAGAIDPADRGMNECAILSHGLDASDFGSKLASVMLGRTLTTGKLRSLGMQAVAPEELPPTVVRKLLALRGPAARTPGSPRDIEGFDTWYRVLGTAKVGGYVGTLACGLLVRPCVLPSSGPLHTMHRAETRVRYAPFPKREVTAGLLDEANRVAGATTEGIQHLNPFNG